MVSLLLIISFLIHILTIIFLFQLLKRYSQLKVQNTDEIEQLLSTYLAEIKSENDRLQKQFSHHNDKQTSKIIDETKRIKRNGVNTYPSTEPSIAKQSDINELIQNKNTPDVIETSIEAKALQLHNEGYSITEIAQKLNRGKTEVSLIIELNGRSRSFE